jgi:hypothetical protein
VAVAGIVHEHVDRADPALDVRNHGRNRLGVGDVQNQRMRALAERLEFLLVGVVAHGAGDGMAVAQCSLRQGPAEAGGNAGDEECLCHGMCLSIAIAGSI